MWLSWSGFVEVVRNSCAHNRQSMGHLTRNSARHRTTSALSIKLEFRMKKKIAGTANVNTRKNVDACRQLTIIVDMKNSNTSEALMFEIQTFGNLQSICINYLLKAINHILLFCCLLCSYLLNFEAFTHTLLLYASQLVQTISYIWKCRQQCEKHICCLSTNKVWCIVDRVEKLIVLVISRMFMSCRCSSSMWVVWDEKINLVKGHFVNLLFNSPPFAFCMYESDWNGTEEQVLSRFSFELQGFSLDFLWFSRILC